MRGHPYTEVVTDVASRTAGSKREGKPSARASQAAGPAHRAAWSALASAHAAVVCALERAFAGASLPPLGWYEVLQALARAPEGTLRPRELVEHVNLSKSGLTRLLDRLEQAGLVERRRCPKDRRGYHVLLTAEGRRIYQRMRPLHDRTVREHLGAALDERQASELAALLRKLAAGQCERAA